MKRRGAFRPPRAGALCLALLALSVAGAAVAVPESQPAATQSIDHDAEERAPGSFWPAGSEAWLVFRTGIRAGAAFRTIATILERGRWIQADVGYVDGGDGHEYRLFWAGTGGVPIARSDLRLELKGALAKSFGSASAGERHLFANLYLSALPRERWKLEISHTEALPLNDAAARLRALDRARLEYEVGRYQLGVGWAGSQAGDGPWHHHPFVSVSRSVRGIGEIEVWLQRVERADRATERLQLRLTRKLTQ